MQGDLEIREFADSDEAAYVRLFEKVVGRKMPVERFRWLFFDSPLGRGICNVAALDGELVGSTAAIVIPFVARGELREGVRLQDAMVDAECRGRGVFSKVMMASEEIFNERRMACTFAFPNENSLGVMIRRFGYALLAEIPTLRLALSDFQRETSGGLRFECSPPDVFTADDAELFDRHWDDVPYHVRRSPEFLKLRYSPEVGRRYQVVRGFDDDGRLQAFAVGKYFEPEDSIDVVELVCDPDPGVMAAVLKALADEFSGGEKTGFETWIWGANPLTQTARDIGFRVSGRTTNLIWRTPSAKDRALPGEGELLLTMGDSDVY